jgi:hypothetical protein
MVCRRDSIIRRQARTYKTAFIGLDTHKEMIAVAMTEGGRDDEELYYGQIANDREAVFDLVKKLAGKHAKLLAIKQGVF